MTSRPATENQASATEKVGEGRWGTIVRDALPESIADLARLVRIPSVSWPAFDAQRVVDSADEVARLLEGLGVFETVDVVRAPLGDGSDEGQPAVLARRPARNGRATVLLYAHHDVQPPGEETAWDSPPYEPTVRGDRLYGRGTADDKAGIMVHVAAIRALLRELGDREPELGITVFIEGEEEYGSPSFAGLLGAHRDFLEADAIVVADSANWDVDTPALTVSLRGNVTCRMTVRTLDHALHSGLYGGAVPDAMLATTRILASLHGEDGSVAVRGLRAHTMCAPSYDDSRLRTEAGLLDGVETIGSGEVLERLWGRPAITVTGIDAPSVETASNTLAAEVSVRLSVRVAPGQDATQALDALTDHVRAHTPFGARVEFDDVDAADPFLVNTGGDLATAMTESMREAWGIVPVETGMGGSIPFVPTLARTFPKAEILITGVEDPDTRAHSPNESLHLGVFARAIETEARFLARVDGRIEVSPRAD